MQSKKKILLTLITIIVIGLSGFFLVKLFNNNIETLSLNKDERNWILNNKNQLIDLAILNKIPVINYSGEGIFFDFIEYVEKKSGLEFNKIPYSQVGDNETPYILTLSKEHGGELEIYKDNYVIVSLNGIKYNSTNELENLKLGVLTDDRSMVRKYLPESITYIDHEDANNFMEELKNNTINGIILPKIGYLNYILENELTISYNISEYEVYYYMALGDNEILNSILTKYYKTWYKNNYINSYNTHLLDSYFKFSNCDKNELLSKRYLYGYIEDLPYDKDYKSKEIGINNVLIDKFTDFANIEVISKKYNNRTELVKDFNENNLDIIFDNISSKLYVDKELQSIGIYTSDTVVLSHLENKNVFNSLKSLNNQNVLTIKDTKLNEYLESDNYNLLTYNTIYDLIDDLKKDDVIILDKETYNFNIKEFDQFKIDFIFNIDKYGFKLNSNEAFNKIFNFYITYMPTIYIKQDGYLSLYKNSNNFEISVELILVVLVIIVSLLAILLFKNKPKIKLKGSGLSKTDKLKYIDMLTSLKNRNYLNDNIEYWDSVEVYPQSVVIIDLNNVSDINDNYGHEEGDKVIIEAANILIKNQLSKTEIIRTNGNEFLIYMVEYDEKQVISYIKKLNKEFKNLSYGYGAAIGYSMIVNGTKTIDDAYNEAILDMKTIKEELNNE